MVEEMNVSTIMLIIEGIKLLQAMEKRDGMSVEIRNRLVAEALPNASEDDVAAIAKAINTIDPNFLKRLCEGVGEALARILGGK